MDLETAKKDYKQGARRFEEQHRRILARSGRKVDVFDFEDNEDYEDYEDYKTDLPYEEGKVHSNFKAKHLQIINYFRIISHLHSFESNNQRSCWSNIQISTKKASVK